MDIIARVIAVRVDHAVPDDPRHGRAVWLTLASPTGLRWADCSVPAAQAAGITAGSTVFLSRVARLAKLPGLHPVPRYWLYARDVALFPHPGERSPVLPFYTAPSC